jgi:hypothetical protein
LKQLSGSSIKGPLAPIYDKLNAEDKRKLEHLEAMERKGFEVEKLKNSLLERVEKEEERKDKELNASLN